MTVERVRPRLQAPESGEWARAPDGRPALIWVTDGEGNLVHVSGPGAPWVGDASVGAPVEALVPGPLRARLSRAVRDALRGTPALLEVELEGAFWELAVEPAAGGTSGVARLSMDAAARKEAEAALAESERRLEIALEATGVGLWVWEAAPDRLVVNPQAAKILGAERDFETSFAELTRRLHPDDHEAVRDRFKRHLSGERDYYESQHRFRRDGEWRWVLDHGCVVEWDDEGRPRRVVGTTQDITERKRAADALAESEHRLDMTLRAAELGLWEWNPLTGQLMMSERTAAIVGERLEDVEPTIEALTSRLHPDDLEPTLDSLRAHSRGETPDYEARYRLRHRSGEWRWVLARGRVMRRDPEGRALQMLGTIQDVSEEVDAEEKQRELQAQLVQAQKMESVGQLAGGIAHDFNNLLTVILGNLEMAIEDVEAAGVDAADLVETRAAAERASSLTRRLLTFSRQRSLEKASISLNEVVEGVGQMLERALPGRIAIELDLDPEAPRIDADVGQLEQVLLNLCVNARDAIEGDGLVRVETRARDGMAELTVRDDGAGMSPETRRRALEPFFTTKEPQGGTGLGLAMVYGIVTQHGGELLLDSEEGRGTRVVMCFPPSAGAGRTASPPGTDAAVGRGTVLVIEDESHVRRLICRTLTRGGYDVLEACDGVEGVAAFEAHADQIDLVIVDAIMPRMDGRQATERILALRPNTRILFSTGYHAGGFGDLAERHRLLSKPYTPRVLLDAVGQVMDAASATP